MTSTAFGVHRNLIYTTWEKTGGSGFPKRVSRSSIVQLPEVFKSNLDDLSFPLRDYIRTYHLETAH